MQSAPLRALPGQPEPPFSALQLRRLLHAKLRRRRRAVAHLTLVTRDAPGGPGVRT